MTADRDLEPTRHHRWLVAHESGVKVTIVGVVVFFVAVAIVVTVLDGSWTAWLSAVAMASVGSSIWLSIGANRRHIEQYDRRHPAGSGDGPSQ
ncbi:hypothetical protein [Cellulomonas sp. P5_C5]